MGGREQDTANRLMGRAEKTLAHSCKPAQGRASLSTWAAAACERAPSLGLSSQCVLTSPVPTGLPVPALHFSLLTSWGSYFDPPHIGKVSFSDLWVTRNSGIASARPLSTGAQEWSGGGGVRVWLVPCCHLSCWCFLLTKVTGTLYWLLITLVMAGLILRPRKKRQVQRGLVISSRLHSGYRLHPGFMLS